MRLVQDATNLDKRFRKVRNQKDTVNINCFFLKTKFFLEKVEYLTFQFLPIS